MLQSTTMFTPVVARDRMVAVRRVCSGQIVDGGKPSRRRNLACICKAKDQDVASILGQVKQSAKNDGIQESYRKGAEFLSTKLGIQQQSEIVRILDIAMNPNSLYNTNRSKLRKRNASARRLDVEADMQPVTECLASVGLTREQICRVVSMHPPVLSYSVTERIQPILTYLEQRLELDPAQAIVARPSLLGLSVEDNLERMVGYLQDNGYTKEQIAEFLCSSL